jgi:hypothetical protein
LIPEEPPSKVQCPLCEQDFPFKGQRDTHMKTCKREVTRLMSIQASRMPEHSAMINRWLWTRPPADPIMQQNIRRQQTVGFFEEFISKKEKRIEKQHMTHFAFLNVCLLRVTIYLFI